MIGTILPSSMAFIDFSALNVALPALQEDLQANASGLLWIVNAYSLMLSSLLLVGGSLADRLGRKRVFMYGIGIFAVSSLLCGIAPTTNALIAFRILQGVGAAVMMPGSLSLITALVAPERRGKAIGTWSMFSALTTIIGPVLGGWLAGMGLWRVIFYINLPIAAVSLIVLGLKVAESKEESEGKLDVIGAIMATIGLAGITYGFIEAPEQGFEKWNIAGALGIGVLALIAFVWRESKIEHPMMPLSLFKSRNFSSTNLLTLVLYAALGGFLFFFPLNLIQVQGYSPEIAGFTLLPFAILIGFLSRLSGSLSDKWGPKPLLLIGPLITGIGFYLFSVPELTGGPEAYWSSYFPAIILVGIGMGLTVAPLTTAVMSAAPSQYSGIASGINNTVARAAGVLAIAIMGSVAITNFTSTLSERITVLDLPAEAKQSIVNQSSKLADITVPETLSEQQRNTAELNVKLSFVHTFRILALIAACLAFVGVLLTFYTLRKRSNPQRTE